jgi:hypothetical protein
MSCLARKSFTTRILLWLLNLVRTQRGRGLIGPGWWLDRLAYCETGDRVPRSDCPWSPVWPACPAWSDLYAIFLSIGVYTHYCESDVTRVHTTWSDTVTESCSPRIESCKLCVCVMDLDLCFRSPVWTYVHEWICSSGTFFSWLEKNVSIGYTPPLKDSLVMWTTHQSAEWRRQTTLIVGSLISHRACLLNVPNKQEEPSISSRIFQLVVAIWSIGTAMAKLAMADAALDASSELLLADGAGHLYDSHQCHSRPHQALRNSLSLCRVILSVCNNMPRQFACTAHRPQYLPWK